MARRKGDNQSPLPYELQSGDVTSPQRFLGTNIYTKNRLIINELWYLSAAENNAFVPFLVRGQSKKIWPRTKLGMHSHIRQVSLLPLQRPCLLQPIICRTDIVDLHRSPCVCRMKPLLLFRNVASFVTKVVYVLK